jgi:guanosine-3',5'-bis(diphosphate) 3'-pyrophosphohydrolase
MPLVLLSSKKRLVRTDARPPAERVAVVHETRDQSERIDGLFGAILNVIRTYMKETDLALLEKAYQFAKDAHKHQLRKSGAPYIEHCLETARILAELKMDVVTVSAGLLHDVVEDTGITIETVRDSFGEEVALLVDGVTKISELKFHSRAEKQAENFRKMIFSMAKDLRIIMIKFADRLNNMRTLEYLPQKKAERIALETREIYAPLAHRFGIAQIRWELEDLALKTLDPEAYRDLLDRLQEQKSRGDQYIKKISVPILKELEKERIRAEITGRVKSLYSIYQKMKQRGRPFEEIFDILAIRVIVDQKDECYFVLGTVHNLFTPVHDRFKDYIATPKLNAYQSLHTTVIGPQGKMIEIQIRTHDMHRVSEIGIAAHWKYKEGKADKSQDELDRYSAWLREMIDWQKDEADPEEYMDALKTDLFRSEVFVFTPKGDLFKLPQGSTPIDFAFAVHTDVGFHCIGAKVNDRIVPLNLPVKNGDTIEILTSTTQKPHQDWLTFAKTSKARSKIKRWLKEAKYQEAVKLGEEILVKGIKRYRIQLSSKEMRDAALKMGKTGIEQLYADLGQGDIPLKKVLRQLIPEKSLDEMDENGPTLFTRFLSKARKSAKGILVQGMDHFLVRFAKCCHPVPGDPIAGFITRGKGIVIHRRDCPNAVSLTLNPERHVDVSWDVGIEGAFLVQLRILSQGRKDFLKDVGDYLASMNTNIVKMDMDSKESLITAYLILEVKDLTHLTQIIKRLNGIKGVLSVERNSGKEIHSDTSR